MDCPISKSPSLHYYFRIKALTIVRLLNSFGLFYANVIYKMIQPILCVIVINTFAIVVEDKLNDHTLVTI